MPRLPPPATSSAAAGDGPDAGGPPRPAVPLIILTGFLGAGKTTVLNRVLGAQHHRRVAVLVNELGRIDIDAALIRGRAGDVLELTGGCVCHQIGVQRELISALGDVIRRSKPDVIVLETTGIAEPEAILEALAAPARVDDQPADVDDGSGDGDGDGDGDVTREPTRGDDVDAGVRFAPVAVVTVVDGVAGLRQLDRHPEARDQVTAADHILISKLDECDPETLVFLHARLHELNAAAERAAFPDDAAGTAALVPWLLTARPLRGTRRPARSNTSPRAPDATGTGAPPHAHPPHQLTAATYVDDEPLIGEALLLACDGLGDRLIRAKGFVHLAGEARRGFLERAGDKTSLKLGEPWNGEPRQTRLVVIGEGIDEGALYRRLWACRVGARRQAPPAA